MQGWVMVDWADWLPASSIPWQPSRCRHMATASATSTASFLSLSRTATRRGLQIIDCMVEIHVRLPLRVMLIQYPNNCSLRPKTVLCTLQARVIKQPNSL